MAKALLPPLIGSLHAAWQAMTATARAHLATTGLARDEFDAIVALGGTGDQTCKALAKRVLAPNPTLTRTLARLEGRGLIAFTRGADAREKIVSLTPAGRGAYEEAFQPHLAIVHRAIDHLTPAEQATLQDLLRKLAQGFAHERPPA